MIRKITREDKNGVLDVATASGLFEPEQVGELAGMLGDHFDTEEPADVWLTDEDNGKPVGVVYAAPERKKPAFVNSMKQASTKSCFEKR